VCEIELSPLQLADILKKVGKFFFNFRAIKIFLNGGFFHEGEKQRHTGMVPMPSTGDARIWRVIHQNSVVEMATCRSSRPPRTTKPATRLAVWTKSKWMADATIARGPPGIAVMYLPRKMY